MADIRNISTLLDILIILVPMLIIGYLVFKFLIPKKPVLGIGLALGGGLLGAWLLRNRLQKAFDVEEKLAEHNEMMAKFKEKQKQRFQAVMANKQVIANLEKQRRKLAKKEQQHATELKLIDAELKDRRALNEEILSGSADFLRSVDQRSADRQKLLRQYYETGNPADQPLPKNKGTAQDPDIELDGYRLEKG